MSTFSTISTVEFFSGVWVWYVPLLTLYSLRGSSYEKTIKTVCFLADMGDFGAFNEVYGKYFTEKPARSCVAVKELPKNVLCEVEVIAEI